MRAIPSYGLAVALIVGCFLIGGGITEARAGVAGDKAAIQKVIDRYARALNDGDIDTVMQLYAQDGVFMPSTKPTSTGPAEVKAAYKIVFDTLDFDIVFHVKEIVPFGSLAYVRTSSGGHIKLIDKGVTIVNRSRELFIMRKHNGAWKIARYIFNESAPEKD